MALVALAVLASCAAFPSYRDRDVPMTSMAVFDPLRYTGLWYEIASFPAPFQAGCTGTRATYGLAEGWRAHHHRGYGRDRRPGPPEGPAAGRAVSGGLLGALGRRGLSHGGRGCALGTGGMDPEP